MSFMKIISYVTGLIAFQGYYLFSFIDVIHRETNYKVDDCYFYGAYKIDQKIQYRHFSTLGILRT